MGEWKKYFMRLLEEVEHKIVKGGRREKGEKDVK